MPNTCSITLVANTLSGNHSRFCCNLAGSTSGLCDDEAKDPTLNAAKGQYQLAVLQNEDVTKVLYSTIIRKQINTCRHVIGASSTSQLSTVT